MEHHGTPWNTMVFHRTPEPTNIGHSGMQPKSALNPGSLSEQVDARGFDCTIQTFGYRWTSLGHWWKGFALPNWPNRLFPPVHLSTSFNHLATTEIIAIMYTKRVSVFRLPLCNFLMLSWPLWKSQTVWLVFCLSGNFAHYCTLCRQSVADLGGDPRVKISRRTPLVEEPLMRVALPWPP